MRDPDQDACGENVFVAGVDAVDVVLLREVGAELAAERGLLVRDEQVRVADLLVAAQIVAEPRVVERAGQRVSGTVMGAKSRIRLPIRPDR